MKMHEGLFRLLTRLYPAEFRRQYQHPMQQAFRDHLARAGTPAQRAALWIWTLSDLARGVTVEHIESWKTERIQTMKIAAYVLFLTILILLGRYELRTDDTGMVVFFILLSAFVLTWMNPERRWLWSLVGWCVPAAEQFWGRPLPGLPDLKSRLLLLAFVTGVGLVGSFAASLLRRTTTLLPKT